MSNYFQDTKKVQYPKAPNYYLMCPKHNACPGFRQITAGMKFPFIIYCHYKQCPELLEALLLQDWI